MWVIVDVGCGVFGVNMFCVFVSYDLIIFLCCVVIEKDVVKEFLSGVYENFFKFWLYFVKMEWEFGCKVLV